MCVCLCVCSVLLDLSEVIKNESLSVCISVVFSVSLSWSLWCFHHQRLLTDRLIWLIINVLSMRSSDAQSNTLKHPLICVHVCQHVCVCVCAHIKRAHFRDDDGVVSQAVIWIPPCLWLWWLWESWRSGSFPSMSWHSFWVRSQGRPQSLDSIMVRFLQSSK